MKEQSVLELQNEIFAEIFGYAEIAARIDRHGAGLDFHRAGAEEPGRGKKARRPKVEDIALGIAEGVDEGDSQARHPGSGSAQAAQRRDRADEAEGAGEAEVLFIGRQRARWTRCATIRFGSAARSRRRRSAYSGTLGCFCKDDETGARSILSNNHVLADVNRSRRGQKSCSRAALDRGKPASDVIAQLTRFVPVQFGGLPNLVDAAVAALTEHGRAGGPSLDLREAPARQLPSSRSAPARRCRQFQE